MTPRDLACSMGYGRMLAVETIDLTKDYHAGFWRERARRALDRLRLRVEAGEIFGLLGPNGAGKTTALKILLGLVHPTSGSARLLGRDFRDTAVHQHVGYLPENPYLYQHLTAEEFMNYAGALFGLSVKERARRARNLLERAGLGNCAKLPLGKFSKGMLQRIGLAQALINDPDLVFLDEPMSGLDPVGRREVRNLILELRANGKTVFFSTHILSDAETLCDRVAILDRGRLRGYGALQEILRVHFSSTEVVLEKPSQEVIADLEPYTSSVVRTGSLVRLVLAAEASQPEILAALARWRAKVVSFNPVQMSLEDYFMERVGNDPEPSSKEAETAADGQGKSA
jgi:ABC-2 type transport system ATP-binding protein